MGSSAEVRFEACLDALYGTLVDPARLPEALGRITALVDATAMALIRTDARTDVVHFVPHGYDLSIKDEFIHYYAAIDPGKSPILRSASGVWLEDDSLYDRRRSPSPEYVADFAGLAGIGWFRGAKLQDWDDGGASVVSIVRPADARPFDAANLVWLQRLYPHLARVTRLREAQAVDLPSGATSDAVESLAAGVCVVDARLRVVSANRSALRIVEGGGPLHLRSGVLGAAAAAVQAQLRQAVHLATHVPRQARSFSPNPEAPLAQRVQVRVLPLDDGTSLGRAPGGPFALLIVAAGATALRPVELGQLYALTPSEADLVSLLAQGLSPRACAERREVSISTVRTQLKCIYAKTGVDSLARLLSLVLALPGQVPVA